MPHAKCNQSINKLYKAVKLQADQGCFVVITIWFAHARLHNMVQQQTRNVGQCPTWWAPCRI